MKKYLVYAPEFMVAVFPGRCAQRPRGPRGPAVKDLEHLTEEELEAHCVKHGWRLWDWFLMQWVV